MAPKRSYNKRLDKKVQNNDNNARFKENTGSDVHIPFNDPARNEALNNNINKQPTYSHVATQNPGSINAAGDHFFERGRSEHSDSNKTNSYTPSQFVDTDINRNRSLSIQSSEFVYIGGVPLSGMSLPDDGRISIASQPRSSFSTMSSRNITGSSMPMEHQGDEVHVPFNSDLDTTKTGTTRSLSDGNHVVSHIVMESDLDSYKRHSKPITGGANYSGEIAVNHSLEPYENHHVEPILTGSSGFRHSYSNSDSLYKASSRSSVYSAHLKAVPEVSETDLERTLSSRTGYSEHVASENSDPNRVHISVRSNPVEVDFRGSQNAAEWGSLVDCNGHSDVALYDPNIADGFAVQFNNFTSGAATFAGRTTTNRLDPVRIEVLKHSDHALNEIPDIAMNAPSVEELETAEGRQKARESAEMPSDSLPGSRGSTVNINSLGGARSSVSQESRNTVICCNSKAEKDSTVTHKEAVQFAVMPELHYISTDYGTPQNLRPASEHLSTPFGAQRGSTSGNNSTNESSSKNTTLRRSQTSLQNDDNFATPKNKGQPISKYQALSDWRHPTDVKESLDTTNATPKSSRSQRLRALIGDSVFTPKDENLNESSLSSTRFRSEDFAKRAPFCVPDPAPGVSRSKSVSRPLERTSSVTCKYTVPIRLGKGLEEKKSFKQSPLASSKPSVINESHWRREASELRVSESVHLVPISKVSSKESVASQRNAKPSHIEVKNNKHITVEEAAALRQQAIEESKPPTAVTPKSVISPQKRQTQVLHYFQKDLDRELQAVPVARYEPRTIKPTYYTSRSSVVNVPVSVSQTTDKQPSPPKVEHSVPIAYNASSISERRPSCRRSLDPFNNTGRIRNLVASFEQKCLAPQPSIQILNSNRGSYLKRHDSVPDLSRDEIEIPENVTKDDSFIVEDPDRHNFSGYRSISRGFRRSYASSGLGIIPETNRNNSEHSKVSEKRKSWVPSVFDDNDSTPKTSTSTKTIKVNRVPSNYQRNVPIELDPSVKRHSSYVAETNNNVVVEPITLREGNYSTNDYQNACPDVNEEESLPRQPIERTPSCMTLKSATSKQTIHYEGEIDQMFKFVEMEPVADAQEKMSLTNDAVNQDQQEQAPSLTLSAYRKLTASRASTMKPPVEPLRSSDLLPWRRSYTPSSQVNRSKSPYRPDVSQYSHASRFKQQHAPEPRFSPVGTVPMLGYEPHDSSLTPSNSYRTSEILPGGLTAPLWKRSHRRGFHEQSSNTTATPSVGVMKKLTSFMSRFGGAERPKNNEVDDDSHARGRPLTRRSDDFRHERAITPDGDGTLRKRREREPYNVSLRGSKTPAPMRRAPLATSTPLRPGGGADVQIKQDWNLARQPFSPRKYKESYDFRAKADSTYTDGPSKQYGLEEISPVLPASHKPGNAANPGGEETDQSVAKTTTLVTSTPRNSFSVAHGKKQRNILDTWADSALSTITTGTNREQILTEYNQKLARLHVQKRAQEEQYASSQNVLRLARRRNKNLSELRDRQPAELTAARTLLLAHERIFSIEREVYRIEQLMRLTPVPPMLCPIYHKTMTISNITVSLGPRFATQQVEDTYGFIILMRCGSEVEATAPLTVQDSARQRVRQIHFVESVRFTNLPLDFTVVLEVYAMPLRAPESDFVSCFGRLYHPTKAPAQEDKIGGFVRCGILLLNSSTVGFQSFYMDEVQYPLEGTIQVHSVCTSVPNAISIDFRGFLTLYQVISGQGSWIRFWAVLRCGLITLWKDPSEEQMEKAPVAIMDLSKCTNTELTEAPREVSMRNYSFAIDMIVPSRSALIDRKRLVLAADSRDQCKAWLSALNETITMLRARVKQ